LGGRIAARVEIYWRLLQFFEPLLENGEDIDARTRIDDCVTPVQLAESCGCKAAISIFGGVTSIVVADVPLLAIRMS
jgi:hypothetical protein